jgi:hypothetical protein
MDDQPSRLVDDEEVLVFVCESQIERLGLEPATTLPRLDLNRLPRLEPVALGPSLPVDSHRSHLEQALGLGTRADPLERREEPVEPLSGGVCRDSD